MKVTPPITITPAMLTTPAVAEPDTAAGEVAWNAATAYTTGALAVRTTTHRVYERLAPGGTDATVPESAPDKWRDAGPTNRWAMFDLRSSTQTVVAGGAIECVLTTGVRNTSAGLRGLYGRSVTITMHVGATKIYERTISLLRRTTTSWRQYYFGEFKVRSAVVVYDLPMTSLATITIHIEPYNGEARCGGVIIGTDQDVGTILDEPTSEVSNFSKIERDDFGNVSLLVKRRNVPALSYRLMAPVAWLDRLRDLRDQLDAAPALWSGKDGSVESTFFDTLLLLALVKKFTITLKPTYVLVELQLEEL